MQGIKIRIENQAVAGVIEALLLVALVAIVISMIQLQYIPQIMEQREAEHMDLVSNQFSSLKSMMELQAITHSTAPISSMLTLGSRELPYFISAGASGEVKVHDKEKWVITVLQNHSGYYYYPLTSITYEAYNVYFVPQTYVLEGGGIIVSQPDGQSVMRADPSLSVINGSFIQVIFNLPVIIGVHGKNLTDGTGNCYIRTNYTRGPPSDNLNDTLSINISTQYPNAWNESLAGMLGTNVNYKKGSSYVEITRKNKDIHLKIEYYYITTQIGPGWVI